MAVKRQNDGYIGVGNQVSKGTGVAPTKFFKWDGKTAMSAKQAFEIRREGGAGLYPELVLKQNHKPDGGFATLARPDGAAWLFASLLGADAVTGAADPYTHTITPANSVPWRTIERRLADQNAERIIDAVIKSIVVEGEQGLPIKLSVEYLGISAQAGVTPATPSYESDQPFMFFHGTYTLDGTVVTKIPSFKLEIVNLFDEELFTNAITREDIPLIGREINLNFDLLFENDEQYRKTYYGSTTGTSPANTIATGDFEVDLNYTNGAGAARQMQLTIPKLAHVEAVAEKDSEPGTLRYSCVAHGLKDVDDFITAVFQNGEANAYV